MERPQAAVDRQDRSGQLADASRLAALAESGLMDVRDDDVLDRLAALACRVLQAPTALVSLVDDRRQHFAGQSGLAQPWATAAGTPLSHSLCRHVVEGGLPLLISDAVADPRVAGNGAIEDLDVRAYAGFPITDVEGRVLGSFCVLDSRPRQWTTHELRTVADLAAAAESDLRARIALRRSTSRLALLEELTGALHAELDVDLALVALAQRVVPGLADLCVIDLVDDAPDWLRPAVISAADEGLGEAMRAAEQRRRRRDNPRSGVRRVLESGTSEVVELTDDALAEVAGDPVLHQHWRSLRMVSLVIVPIVSHAGVEGALSLMRVAGSANFDRPDLQLAEEIGRRVGVAVGNARAYEREQRTALAFQHSLLPDVASVEGVEVAVRYRPSAQGAQVGGDWYDLLCLPTGGVGVAVGDVAGHDMVAAAGMGQIRAVLRSYAWDGAGPGEVLQRVCRLVRALDAEQMATVFYARLDPAGPDRSRLLTYASAGHPSPLLLDPSGAVGRLAGATSPLIGVEVPDRDEVEVVLVPGSTLVLFTDGLVERRRGGPEDGVDRLASVVAAGGDATVDELAESVLEQLTPDEGWEDDVALLVLRVPA